MVFNSWGVSLRASQHIGHNSYRSGAVSTSDVAFLACPGLVQALAGDVGTRIAEREPHIKNPVDLADDYGSTSFFQTDGPMWSNPADWKVARNYLFGDGHGRFIFRNHRSYTASDSF